MKLDEETVLSGVREYGDGNGEEGNVFLKMDKESKRLCIVSYNEGGYNSTWIDAEQLYEALKNYFENNTGEK